MAGKTIVVVLPDSGERYLTSVCSKVSATSRPCTSAIPEARPVRSRLLPRCSIEPWRVGEEILCVPSTWIAAGHLTTPARSGGGFRFRGPHSKDIPGALVDFRRLFVEWMKEAKPPRYVLLLHERGNASQISVPEDIQE